MDPIDGTKNFVHGSRDHATMIGEVRSGEVVRGWIWQPQYELAYVAELGAGALRNGERVVRPGTAATRVARRHLATQAGWGAPWPTTCGPMELTWVCCGIDYPHLVQGDADDVLYGRAPWDHVPGGLILTEAGGFLGTFDGGPYRPTDDYEVAGAHPAASRGRRPCDVRGDRRLVCSTG